MSELATTPRLRAGTSLFEGHFVGLDESLGGFYCARDDIACLIEDIFYLGLGTFHSFLGLITESFGLLTEVIRCVFEVVTSVINSTAKLFASFVS